MKKRMIFLALFMVATLFSFHGVEGADTEEVTVSEYCTGCNGARQNAYLSTYYSSYWASYTSNGGDAAAADLIAEAAGTTAGNLAFRDCQNMPSYGFESSFYWEPFF